ncbi:YcaO-like family protein [Mycobacterium szulgai]|uniref:YcaO-like family protein n=1 Tax=Mycobacterium szulgai TaxID=1787 RepID=UPI000A1EA100|nr:YcaO-like family protein [Mycobacterium szulgai]
MTTLQSAAVQRSEREYSLADAAHRALTAIGELGLNTRLEYYGGNPTVWRCQLLDRQQQPVPSGLGYGKGDIQTARVGAIYEALEVLLAQEFRPDTLQLRSCADVAMSPLAGEAYADLLAMQPEQRIACRIYSQINGDNELAVPLFLSNIGWAEDTASPLRAQIGDTTDYESLARYSSNRGSAIGGSFAEAAVHSLNEAIERDAISLFLIQTFLAAQPTAPAFLDPQTLPHDLRELLGLVQERLSRQVWLIDITSDLDVPATLAYASAPGGGSRRGYGASLSRHYSVYQALTELLQVELTHESEADRLRAIELLAEYPTLQACAACELPAPSRPAETSAFVPYIDTDAPSSPSEHLSRVVDKLAWHGYSAYLHEVHTSSNGVTTVHTQVPDLENFYMIAGGSAVVPGRRGIRAMQQPAWPRREQQINDLSIGTSSICSDGNA